MTNQQGIWSEEDWLSTDWLKTRCNIVDYLDERAGVPIRQRKWRLFLVACIRRVWHVFKDERCYRLADAVEQRADGLITQEQLDQQWIEAGDPPCEDGGDPDDCPPERRAAACACQALGNAALGTVQSFEAYNGAGWAAGAAEEPEAENQVQIELLRDIFGNPFRPVTVDLSWRVWNDGVVVKLAQGIYDDRAFDRLAVLADALEDAGCQNPDILTHCRQPGEHVRGCWVMDLLLGKE